MNDCARRYYRSLVAGWQGELVFTVGDRAAVRRAGARARMTAFFVRLVPRLRMSTTLAESAADTFHHTTRVSVGPVVLFTSEETITLAGDGAHFRIDGAQCPRVGPNETYAGTGEVSVAADGATYEIAWLGRPLLQRTRVEGARLRLTQETSWSRAEVLLERL